MIHLLRNLLPAITFGAMLAVSSSAESQEGPTSDLLKQQFPQVHEAIFDIPTLENGAKQALVAVFSTMIEMSAPEVGGAAIERAFGISLQKVLEDVAADPTAAAEVAAGKFGEGLAEDAAVSMAAALYVDYLMARPPFADLPQDYRIILGAAFRAILEEGYSLVKATSNPAAVPEVLLSGLIDRAQDVYAIAVESNAVADVQRSAFIASAQSIESAAVLAQLKTARSGAVALATVRQTQDILAEMVGNDDAEAVREIANLAFIALLSQQRGDAERALSIANRMLAVADKADNIGPFSTFLRPVDLLVAINREGFRDSPSEAAFVMVSTTGLRALYDDSAPAPAPVANPVVAPPVVETTPPVPEPLTPALIADGVWGPQIMHAADIGYSPCQESLNNPGCLRALGMSEQAIAFSHALVQDYSGFGRAIEFREIGAVDLAVAEYVGASTWYVPVLLNGTPDLQLVQPTLDLAQIFRDDTSRAMLARYPQASSRDMIVTAHRTLMDGTQRFVLVETLSDQCRACDIVGSAVTFLEIEPATEGRLRPVPIGLHITGPGALNQAATPNFGQRPDLLQSQLNALGYAAGAMDGYPGPTTRTALMEFQAEHCLPITGQPDPATSAALAAADGFEQPCAEARLPEGITANNPLLPGMYVDDLAKCQLESLPYEDVHLTQRIVRPEGSITFGQEGGCTVRRSDIRNGVTLFRGQCFEGNETFEGSWTFDVTSNETFFDYMKYFKNGTPRTFTKCPDDSTLRQAWSAWFDEQSAVIASGNSVEAVADKASEAGVIDPYSSTGVHSGQQVTGVEALALSSAISRCWNAGALSTEAFRATITVEVTFDQRGVPKANSIRMLHYEGGSESAANEVFETARRAILRCGVDGYSIPQDANAPWHRKQFVFDPNGMVLGQASSSIGNAQAQSAGSKHINLNSLSPIDYAGLLALYTADRVFFESSITADETATDPFSARRKQAEVIDQILGSIESVRAKYGSLITEFGDVPFVAEYQEDLKFEIEQMRFRFCLPTGVGGSPVSFMREPLTIYVNVSLDYGGLFDGMAGICAGANSWGSPNKTSAGHFVDLSMSGMPDDAERIWRNFNSAGETVRALSYCYGLAPYGDGGKCFVRRVEFFSADGAGPWIILEATDNGWSWRVQ